MGLTDAQRERLAANDDAVIVKAPLKGQNTYHTDADCQHLRDAAVLDVVRLGDIRVSLRQCATCRTGAYAGPHANR